MTELFNIKSITINGNTIDRVATFYNPKFANKNKVAPSLKCVEELVSGMASSYDFNRQHSDNIRNGFLVVDSSNYDLSYGVKVEVSGNKFSYPADAFDKCTHDRLYLADKVKIQDSDTVLTFDGTKEVLAPIYYYLDEYISSEHIEGLSLEFRDLTPGTVYTMKDYFFGSSSNALELDETSRLKYFYKDKDCTESFGYVSSISSDVVYLKTEEETSTSVFLKVNDNNIAKAEAMFPGYENTKIFVESASVITVGNNKISEITVGDIDSKISITSTAKDGLKVYYPKCKICNFSDAKASHLYISGKYTGHIEGLSNGPVGLHLSADFFDNVQISSETVAGTFGSYDSTDVVNIYVENDLNSTLSNDDLIIQLRRILNFSRVYLE